ncbi:hypothetical protein A8924_0776 [Saccharopolyspora erythraea NRRL 2338]|nr:hypothetical protein [Saccharopolyspora erythraea]PFG93532.1 hypothetical protein A8924_0776 [Saccharopolyspora erythraea NRRL 2338]
MRPSRPMRHRPMRRLAVCTTASLAVAGLSLPAALAPEALLSDALAQESTLPTTPRPSPHDPTQPPESVPVPQPGPIVADAGTGIGMIRILPKTVPTGTILDNPAFEESLPKQALAELGMGLASAQANSGAYLAHERAVADAQPFGFAVQGKAPRSPLSLSQTAVPDHAEPTVNELQPPASPLDGLVKLGVLEGSAHARWDKVLGPCVEPIADARTSLAGVSAGNALPSFPAELTGLTGAAGGASLLNVPNAMQAHSNVRLVDVPGQRGKAVRATSRMSVASVRLFAGTDRELRIDVISEPTLTATSTGDPMTSTVEYQAPVLRISQGGEEIGTIDAAKPRMDLPFDPRKLDLGVVRLSIGELRQDVVGSEVRAGARMFDLHILPADRLGIPTSLAQISFGEQVARAGAPEGGVVCEAAPATNPDPAPIAEGPKAPPLALTSGAYSAVPLFWTGTAMLLLGTILVAAMPRRRN